MDHHTSKEEIGEDGTEAAPGPSQTAATDNGLRRLDTAELIALSPAAALVLRQSTKERELEARNEFQQGLLQGIPQRPKERLRKSQTGVNLRRRNCQRHTRRTRSMDDEPPTPTSSETPSAKETILTDSQIHRIQENQELSESFPAAMLVLGPEDKDREVQEKHTFLESLQEMAASDDDDKKPAARSSYSQYWNDQQEKEQNYLVCDFPDVSELSHSSAAFLPPPTRESSSDEAGQHSKHRVSGLVQPGAYSGAPGQRPARLEAVRFSAISRASASGEFQIAQDSLASKSSQKSCEKPPPSRQSLISDFLSDEQRSKKALANHHHGAGHIADDAARNLGLVEARAVLSDAMLDLAMVADEMDPELEQAKHRRRWIQLGTSLGAVGLFVVGVTILVLHGAGVFHRTTTTVVQITIAPSGSPSSSPTMAPTPFFLPLPEYTRAAIAADPNSTQALAYRWMLEDPQWETYTDTRQLQRFALATVYFATNGDYWELSTNWLNRSVHECQWYSKRIEVDRNNSAGICNADGNYVMLLLTANDLSGSLPPELALLSTLEILDVASNDIGGTIPSQLGLLTSLIDLSVDDNELFGSVPVEISQLTKLRNLLVHTNQISGTIPTELGLLTELETLIWADTETTGTLPSELGLLTSMALLRLRRNLLVGSIPSEIFQMTSIREGFEIHDNSLTGTLPTEIGLLSSAQKIFINRLDLNGTIPTEIGYLTSVTWLALESGGFIGTVPSEVGKLLALEFINLSKNDVIGPLPSEVGLLQKLSTLDVEENRLSSSIPLELFQSLKMLTEFYMFDNHFSGTIPTEIGLMTSLLEAYFDWNELTGSLPSEIALVPNLEIFWVDSTELSGYIPSELGTMTSLAELRLGVTNLSGEIPVELGNLAENLNAVSFHNTSLSGTLPSDLCGVEDLNFTCSDTFCGCYCVCITTSDVSSNMP